MSRSSSTWSELLDTSVEFVFFAGVWSLDMKEDNSYYTKHWREKHRANQIAKDRSVFCLQMKCSGCNEKNEDQ